MSKAFLTATIFWRKPQVLSLLTSSILVLAGCGTIRPVPYTAAEIGERIEQDLLGMYADQDPINEPLGFEEAVARALKYNLDYRLKLMETSLAQSMQDVATMELLPDLIAGAGYVGRNNEAGGRSIGIEDGIESLRPSTALERERVLGNLAFSWNVLDFGVSYLRAKQRADQVLMAEERRRKVIQNLLQDVRNSYWRAVGAEQLIERVDTLLNRVRQALERARQVEEEGLMPQAEVLAYQRALLDAVNLLTLRRQDLELARTELSALMSLPPGTDYTLANTSLDSLPPVPTDIDSLELIALENRPELMEEWYRKRVTMNDLGAAKILLWPNLSMDASGQYDSNVFNFHQRWIDTGIRLSWNLLQLAQLPALQSAQNFQSRTDDARRMALSMAVLTQVRVAVQRYDLSLSELEFAEESLRVDQRLLRVTQASASSNVASELELIRTEARSLLAEYQRYASYSNAQAAWGRLYNSLGLDVLPRIIEDHDLETLTDEIARTLDATKSALFQAAPYLTAADSGNQESQSAAETDPSTMPPSAQPPESLASDNSSADESARSQTESSGTDQPGAAAVTPAPRVPENADNAGIANQAITSCTPLDAEGSSVNNEPLFAAEGRSSFGLPDDLSELDETEVNNLLMTLRSRLESMRQDYSQQPRTQVVSLLGRERSPWSEYLNSWRDELLLNAQRFYLPIAAGCAMDTTLRLVVGLNSDGVITIVRTLSSSGLVEVDQAALELLLSQIAAQPFPQTMAAELDQLLVIMTLRYRTGEGLEI